MGDVDVYRIARLLLEEYGDNAASEVQDKLDHYIAAKDYNAIKVWYEVEDALKAIQTSANAIKQKDEVIS